MSAYPGRPRRSGIRLDPDRLDFELGRRGLTARRLSEFAKVHEVTLSRARHGHPVAERTLERITHALLGVPPLVGADLLLAEPENKKAADASTLEGRPSSVTGPRTKTAEPPEVDTDWSASGGSPPAGTHSTERGPLWPRGALVAIERADTGTYQIRASGCRHGIGAHATYSAALLFARAHGWQIASPEPTRITRPDMRHGRGKTGGKRGRR